MKVAFNLALICIFLLAGVLYTGTFDCTGINDEFDQLMERDVLVNPGNYVSVVRGKLSRDEYNSNQKGKLRLSSGHQGMGVAIVHTNRNTWGKLLFTWGAPWQNGQPSLIISEAVLYGRVMDSFAPRTLYNIVISSSYTVDLDSGNAANPGNSADVWFHNVDGNTMYIEEINGAELTFPMESFCQSGFSGTPGGPGVPGGPGGPGHPGEERGGHFFQPPRLISPANGSVFNHYPRHTTLNWQPVSGAASYTVEIDCFGCCQAGRWCTDVGRVWRIEQGINASSFTFDFVGAQPGRWRVWAVGPRGREGPKSEWWEFSYTR